MGGNMKRLAVVVAVFALTGCYTHEWIPYDSAKTITPAPVKPDEVLIFDAAPTSKPYLPIGIIAVYSPDAKMMGSGAGIDTEELFNQMKKVAAKHGCNFIYMSEEDKIWSAQNDSVKGQCAIWQ